MIDKIITEEDFDSTPTQADSVGVAITNKHAYKKVVINPPSKTDPSALKVIPECPTPLIIPKKERDRINSLVQKEINLDKLGITREKYMRNIALGLDQKEWMYLTDRQGNMVEVLVPAWEKTVKWATEMAAKLHGDMIERKEVEHDIGDKTLEKYKELSVAQLKARMADMLLNKRPVLDVRAE